jgi:hypothetical protein
MTRMNADTAGSGFALRRSLAGLFEKWERPLGTHWLPERPFQENQGSLGEAHSRQGLSGRFGVIRPIALPPAVAE